MFTCGFVRSNFSFAISPSAPQSNSFQTTPKIAVLLFAPVLLDHFFGKSRWKLGIMREVHCECCPSLRAAAEVRGITKHLRQRHFYADHVAARTVFSALNRGTPRVQVAEHGSHVLFRNDYFHLHDRLEQHRLGARASLFVSHRSGYLKSHFIAIHIVITAVHQNRGDVDCRKARQNTVVQRFADARFNRSDEFARDGSADNLVNEKETMFLVEFPFTGGTAAHHFLGERIEIVRGHLFHALVAGTWNRMQLDLAVAVLALAAGLLDVFALANGLLANRLAVRHLRTAHVRLHVVFAQHAVHDNFQVQFAHAGDQRLSGIRLGGNAERRIFLRKPLHGHAQFVLVSLGLWLDGHGNHGRREFDGFEDDLLVFVAERVAGIHVFQTDASANVAGIYFFDFFALVGMHLQQAANA